MCCPKVGQSCKWLPCTPRSLQEGLDLVSLGALVSPTLVSTPLHLSHLRKGRGPVSSEHPLSYLILTITVIRKVSHVPQGQPTHKDQGQVQHKSPGCLRLNATLSPLAEAAEAALREPPLCERNPVQCRRGHTVSPDQGSLCPGGEHELQ